MGTKFERLASVAADLGRRRPRVPFTQTNVAAALGVTQPAVCSWAKRNKELWKTAREIYISNSVGLR